MENNKVDIFDILGDEINTEVLKESKVENTEKYSTISFIYETEDEIEEYSSFNFVYNTKKQIKAFGVFVGFIKYIATSSMIFAVLLLTANFSAYSNLVKSYIYADELKVESSSLLNSVEASKLTNNIQQKKEIHTNVNENKIKSKKSKYSIKKLVLETNKAKPKLDIEITPYENRVIIPKIAKNIPLIDIKQKSVSNSKELENIFMKELEDGVVRYPGSTKPGKDGNTFIFGHSSNYPWIKGDYNDVFSNLGQLSYGDEVIVYYGQKKYTYIIREKKVISPGNTKVLKRNDNKDELTLMTCWPVGTTLNRLILTGEIKK